MPNLEDSTVQNPVKTQSESSHFNHPSPDSSSRENKSHNLAISADKLNTKALLSLLFGIAGIVIPFLSFAAVPLGIYAKQEITKGKTRNNIIATAGIVLGTIVTIVYIGYACTKMRG